jgi:hypothetical protein
VAIRYQQAAPFAPEAQIASGAAEVYSRNLPQLLAQQQAYLRLMEEGTARQQQQAQFDAQLGQQDRQFGANYGLRVREQDQQDRQFGASLGQRAYEFGAGQDFQAARDLFQAGTQERRDVFGAQQQQARDVFGAGQQQQRDVFQAQQEFGRQGAAQQFAAQRDQYAAQVAAQQQQQRFQLQAELQATELTQAEQMRMQRLQHARTAVQADVDAGRLTPEEGADLVTQINTGLNPLQNRQAAAQVRHQEAQDRLLQEQANRQIQLMQRQMDALNPDNFPNRVVQRWNPETGQDDEYWLDATGNIHPFERPRVQAGAGQGQRQGAGQGGGRGGAREMTFEQYNAARTALEQDTARFPALPADASETQRAEREAAVQQAVQQRVAGWRANLPPEPVQPTPVQMHQQALARLDELRDRILPPVGPSGGRQGHPALPPGRAGELNQMLQRARGILQQYRRVEAMPRDVRRQYQDLAETLAFEAPPPLPRAAFERRDTLRAVADNERLLRAEEEMAALPQNAGSPLNSPQMRQARALRRRALEDVRNRLSQQGQE